MKETPGVHRHILTGWVRVRVSLGVRCHGKQVGTGSTDWDHRTGTDEGTDVETLQGHQYPPEYRQGVGTWTWDRVPPLLCRLLPDPQ